jgi:ATP-dependent Clp protease ATP-binding subunit ClpX
LSEPKNSLEKQFIDLFALDSVELNLTQEAKEAIADICLDKKLGVRGLRNVIERALLACQFELPELKDQNVTKIIVTEETIMQNTMPIYIKQDTEQ